MCTLTIFIGLLLIVAGTFDFPKSPKPEQGAGGFFTIAGIVERLAPWIVDRCLDGQSFTAREAKDAIADFACYQRANAIGDALGFGYGAHDDTMGLYSTGSPRKFRPVRENCGLAWDRCTQNQQQEIADKRSVTIEVLIDQIRRLPSVSPVPFVAPKNEGVDA